MDIRHDHNRNNRLFDKWSIVHLFIGILFGLVLNPLAAILIMAAWEPVEIFVISPLLARRGIVFGYETLRNSLSDIVFNFIGVMLGAYVVSVFL